MTNSLKPKGYDFHCHIDLYPDPVEMISSCDKNQIITLAVTTTPKAWPQNRQWASASSYVHAAVGLHPEIVGQRYHETDLLIRYMNESTFIGEVGLDGGSKYQSSWSHQQEVFIRVLQAAQKLGNRVISIHSRKAANEVIEMIKEYTTPDRVLCILHWFSGTKTAARKAVSLGCYFSINSQMIKSKLGRELLEELPSNRLLTETDGPFTSENRRKSVPNDVLATTKHLAKVRLTSQLTLSQELENNAKLILKFAGTAL